jgi:4,5-dihydroxyphthalate decarboxylase
MRALKEGIVRAEGIELTVLTDMAPSPRHWRFLRGREFDVAEVSGSGYVAARDRDLPFRAIPVFPHRRFRHGFIFVNTAKGIAKPTDLIGRKVGTKGYLFTAGLWMRGILEHDYGVQIDKVKWITFEDGHVPEYKDPAFTERAPHGQTFMKMLLAGQIDAAVVMAHDFKNPNVKTVIPNPAEAAAAWYKKYGAIQLNHILVVRESLSKSNPEIVREIYRVFSESKKAAAEPLGKDGIDTRPVGFSANRRNFEVAAQFALEQGIIPRALPIDELFDGTTRALDR